jgi:hypothetical protein
MAAHDETQICLIQNDTPDPFSQDRVNLYNVGAYPTIVSNGISDAWPESCWEADYQVNTAIESPLTISIHENGPGDFTVHFEAEEDVIGAGFYMAATLSEEVHGVGGMVLLPHHVKVYMTPSSTGEPFTLLAGESIDITHTFTVESDWDYEAMGVAAWVARPGGTSVTPCTQGFPLIANEVFQSRWVPTSDLAAVEENLISEAPSLQVYPNPGTGQRTIRYHLPAFGRAQMGVYDAQGRLVEKLAVLNEAGSHSFTWSPAQRPNGQTGSHTGVQFIRLEYDGKVITKELLQIR